MNEINFTKRTSVEEVEEGVSFQPKFDDNGLIPVITVEFETNEILMHGYSNEKALKLSMQTKKAHYFSRSRKKLWKKGEKSGFYQNIMQIKIDDDQDCLIYFVSLEGEKASCHVGYKSCFYRELAPKNDSFSVDLEYTEQEKVFEPQNVYGNIPNPTKL